MSASRINGNPDASWPITSHDIIKTHHISLPDHIRQEYCTPESLTSYAMFLQRRNGRTNKLWITTAELLNEKIARLKSVLEKEYGTEIDPIVYILCLYYTGCGDCGPWSGWFSLAHTYAILQNKMDFWASYKILHQFMKKVLRVKLRDNTELTEKGRKQIALHNEKLASRNRIMNAENTRRRKAIFHRRIELALSRERIWDFQSDPSWTPTERAEQILSYLNITPKVLAILRKVPIGDAMMARWLKEELTEFHVTNPHIPIPALYPEIIQALTKKGDMLSEVDSMLEGA